MLLCLHLVAHHFGSIGPPDFIAGETFPDLIFDTLVSGKGVGGGAEGREDDGGFLGPGHGLESQDQPENQQPAAAENF